MYQAPNWATPFGDVHVCTCTKHQIELPHSVMYMYVHVHVPSTKLSYPIRWCTCMYQAPNWATTFGDVHVCTKHHWATHSVIYVQCTCTLYVGTCNVWCSHCVLGSVRKKSVYMYMYMSECTYMYMYIHVHVHVCTCRCCIVRRLRKKLLGKQMFLADLKCNSIIITSGVHFLMS